MRPGTASRTSPGRVTGRALRWVPVTVIWLAMVGAVAGPAPTLGAPDDVAKSAADVVRGAPAPTTGFARGLARFVDMLMVGSVFPVGRSRAAGGPPGAS